MEQENTSGQDLDVWGGERTTPVLIPRSPAECVIARWHGGCPEGCRACLDFAEELKLLEHGE